MRYPYVALCCAVVANGFVFAPLPSQGCAPPRTVRRAEDEQKDERNTGERLAPVEETLSAFVVGAVAAAGAGVEILDAGAVSSALLAGALVGFAAENENQYGFGMLARGLGKVGYSAFKAATEEKPPAEEVQSANGPIPSKGSSSPQTKGLYPSRTGSNDTFATGCSP